MRKSLPLLMLLVPGVALLICTELYFSRSRLLIEVAWVAYAVLFVAVATLQTIVDRRRLTLIRRADFGLCLRCGYDVRASRDKCPECGAPIPPR